MEIIEQSFEIIDKLDGDAILKKLEMCGRVCYKSEARITDNSAKAFVRNIINRGHESVLEHVSFTVRFITDRGETHELVRHRLASFSQESTRYCDYAGNMTFIKPVGLNDTLDWLTAMEFAESTYQEMRNRNISPQLARSVLPNSLKTEIIVTANLREWRHILKLRTAQGAHPQIRALMCDLLHFLQQAIPVVFDDIEG